MTERGNMIIIEGRRATGKTTLINVMAEEWGSRVMPIKYQRTVWEWYDMEERIKEMRASQNTIFLIDRFHLTEYAMRLHDYATGKFADKAIVAKVYDPMVMLHRVQRMVRQLRDINALTIYLKCFEPTRLQRIRETERGLEGVLPVLDVTWAHASSFADTVIDTTDGDEAASVLSNIIGQYIRLRASV